MENWDILDGGSVSPRGADAVSTQRVIELGQAIIDLVRGTLPKAPSGTVWFLGATRGWETIAMSEEYFRRNSG